MQPLILSTCWKDVTERRIAELKVALCVGDPEPDCEASRKFDVPPSSRRRP
jgi:hypothetical protein